MTWQLQSIFATMVNLSSDLERGRPTYPIVLIAQAAGIPLEPWPDTTELLGAMIATGSLATVREVAMTRIHAAAELARELNYRPSMPTSSTPRRHWRSG